MGTTAQLSGSEGLSMVPPGPAGPGAEVPYRPDHGPSLLRRRPPGGPTDERPGRTWRRPLVPDFALLRVGDVRVADAAAPVPAVQRPPRAWLMGRIRAL